MSPVTRPAPPPVTSIKMASLIWYLGQRTACCTSSSMTIAFIIRKKKCRLAPQRLRAGRDFLACYKRSLYSRKRTFLSVMPQLSVRHHEGLSSPGLVARENGILMLASGQATTTVVAGRHRKNRQMEFSMMDYGIPAGTRCSTRYPVTGRRCCSLKLAQPLHAGGVNLSLATMVDVPFATVDDCLRA